MRLFVGGALCLSFATAAPYPNPSSISDYIRTGLGSARLENVQSKVSGSSNYTNPAEPCAKISRTLSQSSSTYVDPDLALKCLRSVPLDLEGDQKQLDGIELFLNFQSTLGYLKAPPAGYMYPAVDLLQGLDVLRSKLNEGAYTNEYDFQMSLLTLMAKAMDGHLNYQPDILYVFGFGYADSFYSLSTDGKSLPEVYLDSDVDLLANPNTSNSVFPVVEVNGQDVEEFLNDFASRIGGFQDPDAAYNNLFYSIPQQWLGWINSMPYPMSNNQTIRFQNGTTQKLEFQAWSNQDFSGVRDGKSFFQKFCTNSQGSVTKRSTRPSPVINSKRSASASVSLPVSQVAYTPVPTETNVAPQPGYPKPLVDAPDHSVGGFFPANIPDLAVLSITTFEGDSFVEYQDLTREFLATCHKAGKKRLIIDLRGNPGGWVFEGYDLFKQLFPQPEYYPYGASNLRAHPLFNQIGQAISQYYTKNPPSDPEDADYAFGTVFNYHEEVTAHFTDFPSWEEFYGPHGIHGDNFTSRVRYNLSDPIQREGDLTGFGDLKHIQPQTFASEDILILTDGRCSSTCTIFTEFMKTQANVSQVAVGGRKRFGPMQALGGVKGSQDLAFEDIMTLMDEAYGFANEEQQQTFNSTYMTPYLRRATQQALTRSPSATLNWRNNLRKGDTTETPLQFVYEAADCRIFYTPQMISQQDLVWKAAYEAHWGSGQCVEGSTGQPSSISSTVNADAPPPTTDPEGN